MKVKELIDELSSVDGDLDVVITHRPDRKYTSIVTDYQCAGERDGKYYICTYENVKTEVTEVTHER